MVECTRQDVICLHLAAHGTDAAVDPAPRALTAAGIGEALELGEDATSRVDLLRDLTELDERDLVTADQRRVGGFEDPRPVYALTDAGRDRAEAIRARFRSLALVNSEQRASDI